jgi:hypothetical protein
MASRSTILTRHKRAKNRALAFALDMLRVLQNKRGLDWRLGIAEGGTREAVDVIGWKNGNRRVLVEVELRRSDPVTNVVKVWAQITRNPPSKTLVMFQAFSAFYPKKGTQRANAEFIAKEMQKVCRIKYVPLSMDFHPGKGQAGKPVVIGGGRRTYHAERLASRILARLGRMEFRA